MIKDLLKQNRQTFSFEFFPPKDSKSAELLLQSIKELAGLHPSFVSVTYGAGGSTRELTHDLVLKLHQDLSIPVLAHLTCVEATQSDIFATLSRYKEAGIRDIMALRGDLPNGEKKHQSEFVHAVDLVKFIKKHFPEFSVGVAAFPEGHPETPNRLKELDYLKEKVDAGADFMITQLFFDNRDYYDFQERATLLGMTVPIIPGLMPVTTRKGMERMSELALGSRFPSKLLKAIKRANDDEGVARIGIQWTTAQASDLLSNGAPGIHFYTLNRSDSTRKIYRYLGL